MLKKNKGITIIALIITIIIMLILVGVSFKLGTDAIDKARLEDIKTNMLSIQTKAKIIEEKYLFKDRDSLEGTVMEETDKNKLLDGLKTAIEGKENIYKWDSTTLKDNDLSNIKADDNKYYIVWYDIDKASCEVYYTEGYNNNGTIIYSLTDMQAIE